MPRPDDRFAIEYRGWNQTGKQLISYARDEAERDVIITNLNARKGGNYYIILSVKDLTDA